MNGLTVAVPVETMQAITDALGTILNATSELGVSVDDILRAATGRPEQANATHVSDLAPVVSLADYRRKAHGGAA
ncbi:hypothetical protein E1292_35230 [Nonomuraea deserti]|uniref:Uncharacterized protein n=1 Tax=Nonomuraea deserti TaxID=1848322 RepID=A0A4R4V9F8_9ACTN|nr:hypothetical protein [Nonomuraea deserti]TDC98494.1 hypothetical protein E1292_35230 [Nonomuraea deserti]